MDTVDDERAELIRSLDELNVEWEEVLLPRLVEGLLSIRLTTTQLKVLALVSAEPEGSTAQDLAGILDVSLATISGIVDRLESHGVVKRTLDATDGRVRRILATSEGVEVVRKLVSAEHQRPDELLMNLDIEDLRALVRGSRAFINAAKNFKG